MKAISKTQLIDAILQAQTQSDYDLVDKTLRENPKWLTLDIRQILEAYELKRDVLGLKNNETSK